MPEWLQRHLPEGWTATHFLWLGVILFPIMLVGSLVISAWVLVRLPADYFSNPERASAWRHQHPFLRYPLLALKNVFGVLLVGLGVILSLPGVPGQGILTILLGAMLIDFPGKRACERWLLTRRGVLKNVNKLRARYGKEPFSVEPGSAAANDAPPP